MSYNSITRNAGGIYKCLVFDSYNNEASSTLEILINENLPVIFDIKTESPQGLEMISKNEMMILQNSQLFIDCQHNGTSLVWSLPTKEQELDVNPLSIQNIDLENQGTYHCTVSSMGKSVQSHLDVLVIQPSRMKQNEEIIGQVCHQLIQFLEWPLDGFLNLFFLLQQMDLLELSRF